MKSILCMGRLATNNSLIAKIISDEPDDFWVLEKKIMGWVQLATNMSLGVLIEKNLLSSLQSSPHSQYNTFLSGSFQNCYTVKLGYNDQINKTSLNFCERW